MVEDKQVQKKLDKFLKDFEFEAMLKEERHKELVKMLSDFLLVIKEPETKIEYKELDTSGIEAAIASIPTSDPQVPKSIQALGEVIRAEMENNKYQPVRDWKFTLDRLDGDPKGPIQGGRITAID